MPSSFLHWLDIVPVEFVGVGIAVDLSVGLGVGSTIPIGDVGPLSRRWGLGKVGVSFIARAGLVELGGECGWGRSRRVPDLRVWRGVGLVPLRLELRLRLVRIRLWLLLLLRLRLWLELRVVFLFPESTGEAGPTGAGMIGEEVGNRQRAGPRGGRFVR